MDIMYLSSFSYRFFANLICGSKTILLRYSSVFFVISLTIISPQLFAGGFFNPSSASIQIPGNLTIPANAQIGDLLWKSPTVISTLAFQSTEFVTNPERYDISSGIAQGATPRVNDIWTTNIPGLGVRWRGTWRARNFPGGVTKSITLTSENKTSGTGWMRDDSYPQTMWIELVKTGPIQDGSLNIGAVAEVDFACPRGDWLKKTCGYWEVSVTGSTRIQTGPGCTPLRNVDVPLGTVVLSKFTGVGSVAPIEKPFSITLNCSGGVANSRLLPHVTLTDASNADNRSNILSLTKTARPATGVGIQILKDGMPLAYGADSSEDGNPNQWQAGTIMQGVRQYEIPLTARYIQTADTVTPGQADGRATFTLNYQ